MKYDLIIIGGGPAGLTAAIYASRYNLNFLVISENIGGTASTASKVCNFPSYENIKGFELMQKVTKQAKSLGAEIIYDKVIMIKKNKEEFIVSTKKNNYNCRKIIYASGTERLRLNVPGEGKFSGRGISYCASCDALFYKNKIVAVAGGSDAALSSALLLAEFASKVYIIYRQAKFSRAEPYWIHLVAKEKKIQLIFNEEIVEINGKENVEEIKLKTGKAIKADGVFIEIGSVPETGLLKDLKVKLDKKNYVITDKEQRTNIDGIFAAGDVTDNSLKQIVNACGEGAVAAYNVYRDIKKQEDKE
ncbi:MAG: FAD-dependent oxidoreductase [Nanoarchaeota archaeon]